MAIALDDAPVTLNRPLLDGETLAVTVRRGVGRAGVRLVGETAAYTVWIETSGIAVLQRDGAEQGRVPVTGDAQRVALTYASGTLSASVGAYAFPPISDGTAFASLRAEFVVQGGNGQGSTFDEVTVPLPPGLVANVPSPSPAQVTAPTNTPAATPTPTFTPTNTPTRTPTPTNTPIPLPLANTNLLTNPSFASGLAPWNTVNFSAGGVTGGVLEVTQPTTVEYGVVWQSLNTMLPADTPMRFSVALGNSSAVPKRVQVILRASDWANAAICEFVLPANSPLAAHSVRVRTASVWNDILAQVWTYAPDGLPAVRIDDADLQYQPGMTVNTTPDCLNQGGPILVNGQFALDTAGWSYVNYTSFAAIDGQLRVTHPVSASYAAFWQELALPLPSGRAFEFAIDLSNTTGAARDAQLIVRGPDWNTARICSATLPGDGVLRRYTLRGTANGAWRGLFVQVWTFPGTTGATFRADNAAFGTSAPCGLTCVG